MDTLKKGVWPTMITPYNSDGSVDYGAIRGVVDWYRMNGVSGIFSVCQSSEMFFLSLDERIKIAETVAEAAGRCISETEMNEEDIEDYIVRWVR